jgi:hypothetical protein
MAHEPALSALPLGADSVLVGIMPEVAQTLVQPGVDLGALTTRSNLQAGVAFVVARRE